MMLRYRKSSKYGSLDQPTVSARELREGLEIASQYTKWFDRMCEYGFVDGIDYKAVNQKRLTAQGNQTTYTDHEISIGKAEGRSNGSVYSGRIQGA